MLKKTGYILNIACISISSITTFLFALISFKFIPLDPVSFTLFRIFNVLILLFFAFRSKSLTVWILMSIVAGAEFGHDVPEIAKNLQFLLNMFPENIAKSAFDGNILHLENTCLL